MSSQSIADCYDLTDKQFKYSCCDADAAVRVILDMMVLKENWAHQGPTEKLENQAKKEKQVWKHCLCCKKGDVCLNPFVTSTKEVM